MITDYSIQQVREVDLVEVIRRYVPDLKKKGANYSASCPFHDENTASFVVSPVKGMYKCFGCHKSGNNPISFVMDNQQMDFISAVKFLADWFNITLEETKGHVEEAPEQKAKKVDFLNINKQAAKLYQNCLADLLKDLPPVGPLLPVANELIRNRGLSLDTIIEFQIGYAPQSGRLLSPVFKEYGLLIPAEELGLVKVGQNGAYDVYRDRIIFPIHNERGEVVGFGARTMKEVTRDNPKYLNSRDSLVYKKEAVLYGLYQAGKAIRKGLYDGRGKAITGTKFASLVEGYYDVTGFHQGGLPNTVAACGTAFTDGHARLLKKYTSHMVLLGDGDGAGERANLKNVDILLKHGFKVEICPLPKGHDPDSFSRTVETALAVEMEDTEYELVEADEEDAPF